MESTGRTSLEKRIEHFQNLLDEMKEATRESHSVLKDIRHERKEIERIMMGDDVKKLVTEKTSNLIQAHLDKIGPEVQAQTVLIYSRISEECERLVNIVFGKPFAIKGKSIDLRPLFAKKLQVLIQETIDSLEENGGT